MAAKMDLQELRERRALLADRMQIAANRVVIAGGAVRDALMGRAPKDVDVFILGSKKGEKFTLADAEEADIPTWRRSGPFPSANYQLGGLVHQIIPHAAQSVDARAAITDLRPGKPLVLQKITHPVSTLRRGFSFQDRLKMELGMDTIRMLSWHILRPCGPS